MGPTDKLYALKAAAYKASDKASDSGSRAFTKHVGYARALADNAGAQRAWGLVEAEAKALASVTSPVMQVMGGFDPAAVAVEGTDARVRIDELRVAEQRLREEQNTPGIFQMGPIHGGPFNKGGASSSTSGGGSKLPWLLAGAAAVASKLLGWW